MAFWVLLLACLSVFCVSGYMLLQRLWLQPAQNAVVTSEIRDLFSQYAKPTPRPQNPSAPSSEMEAEPTTPERSQAVRDLAANVNADIKGWVTIPGTVIDYPVLQSSVDDPEYYLKRDYTGDYSPYGSIFLDAACSTAGDIQLLYGHSMNNGSMFRSLIEFGDPTVLAAHPVILYDTAEESSQWLIFCVLKTNTRASQGEPFEYIRSGFSSTEDKLTYLYDVMQRSMVNTHVGVNEDDDLLALSTCSYEFDDFRTVVLARRLREGEAVPQVNITAAENTLYPDCWYRHYGGSAYDWPQTFEQARAEGLVAWWYDK